MELTTKFMSGKKPSKILLQILLRIFKIIPPGYPLQIAESEKGVSREIKSRISNDGVDGPLVSILTWQAPLSPKVEDHQHLFTECVC